jgi:tetratricopeptide (TPR) repeat protein
LRYEDKEAKLPKTFLNNDVKLLLIFSVAQNKLAQGYLEESVQLLLKVLDFEKISQLDRVLILDHLACIVAIDGYKKYLNDADRWSQEALRLASYSKTLKGTRGAILIELGRYDEGKKLLLSLTEPGNDDIDIAVSSCYIAKAEYFIGNIESVNDWFVKANEIGVANSILKRIQQEINYYA